jgi:hypothetical protein
MLVTEDEEAEILMNLFNMIRNKRENCINASIV